MLWALPGTSSAEVVHVALLEEFSAMFEQPLIAEVPSLNVTLPFAPGFPAVALTVAVKVTFWPYVLGLLPIARVVVVLRVASWKWAKKVPKFALPMTQARQTGG